MFEVSNHAVLVGLARLEFIWIRYSGRLRFISYCLKMLLLDELILPQGTGHRVKNTIIIRNEVLNEAITEASQSGI